MGPAKSSKSNLGWRANSTSMGSSPTAEVLCAAMMGRMWKMVGELIRRLNLMSILH